jgi:hypothetical protein
MNHENLKIFGLFLFLMAAIVGSQSAHALSYQGRFGCLVGTTFYEGQWCKSGTTGPYASSGAACQAFSSTYTVGAAALTIPTLHRFYCNNSLGNQTSNTVQEIVSCRQGAVVNGVLDSATAMCNSATSCPSGETNVGGVCTASNPCTAAAGQVASSGYYDLGTSDAANPPTTTCNGQCELAYNGGGVSSRAMVGGVYHYFSQGQYVKTANQCSGSSTALTSAAAVPSNSCNPATQDQGTVNGVTVCIDRTSTDSTASVKSSSTTGDVTTTTETTTKNNADGSVEATTTTTEKNNVTGVESTTQTKNTTRPETDPFCVSNPNDPSCQPVDEFCSKNADTLACTKLGSAEADPLGTEERSIANISPVSIGGVGACPAPLTASFLGQPISFSFDALCTYANALRPLVLAMAWLSAGVIFIGGVRNG